MLKGLLGSRGRAKIVGCLFANHDKRYFVRQLTELLVEDSTNISRELARLEKMRILVCEKEGRQKYYRANSECAIFDELRGLALKTTGLADVLRDALSPLADDVLIAFVYGTQAKGTANSASDVDLLVVGDLEETALHSAITRAEEKLHKSVNYTLLSSREYDVA